MRSRYTCNMSSYRPEQLANVVRTVVSRFAAQVPPNVATLVSVTQVKLSPDLKYADIFISAIEGAEKAVGYIKKEHMREMKKSLSHEFQAYTIPVLRLHSDTRGKEAFELETLIDSL